MKARRSITGEPRFESRFDGEYCECKWCVAKGYGVDSWHPATNEFWRLSKGKLHFHQCLACLSEQRQGANGFLELAA